MPEVYTKNSKFAYKDNIFGDQTYLPVGRISNEGCKPELDEFIRRRVLFQALFTYVNQILEFTLLIFDGKIFLFGGVAQLARALPCHGRGCGFESRRSRKILFYFITWNSISWSALSPFKTVTSTSEALNISNVI